MPLPEALFKDLRFAFLDAYNWIRHGGRLPVIVAFPDLPSKKTTLYKIADRLGYRLTNKTVKNPKLVFYFEDSTFGNTQAIREHYDPGDIINLQCTDISKTYVDKLHLDVLGYNTFVDPLTYRGEVVRKSDINALHDGRIIHCPIDYRDDDAVYMVVIDNAVDQEMVMDYRVPVIGESIPHVYKKFKKKEVRFTNQVSYSELHETQAHFSEAEINQMIRFAQSMGASFCELDVLRNKNDERIYIIDVNKTPYGPPFGLDKKEEAVTRLLEAFRKTFL